MNLANYINDLLYRYDCVIVPNFGGFVTNKIGAKIDETSHLFYPPSKQITFNSYLKHNDGLLANHIAACEKISFQEANEKIDKEIFNWNNSLQTSEVILEGVGVLFLNREQQLGFEPKKDSNFLVESFGLSSVGVTEVKREIVEESILKVIKPTQEVTSIKRIPTFVKYAAAAAIALTFGISIFQNLITKQDVSEQSVQKASFVIDTPSVFEQEVEFTSDEQGIDAEDASNVIQEELDAKDQTKAVVPEVKESIEKYFVIAGAFGVKSNAEKKVKQLITKGFNASIIGTNDRGLIQVAYQGFTSEIKAEKALQRIKNTQSKDAWLLVKK